jgi:hypothetical protein
MRRVLRLQKRCEAHTLAAFGISVTHVFSVHIGFRPPDFVVGRDRSKPQG